MKNGYANEKIAKAQKARRRAVLGRGHMVVWRHRETGRLDLWKFNSHEAAKDFAKKLGEQFKGYL